MPFTYTCTAYEKTLLSIIKKLLKTHTKHLNHFVCNIFLLPLRAQLLFEAMSPWETNFSETHSLEKSGIRKYVQQKKVYVNCIMK
jgi:hypothetical protein